MNNKKLFVTSPHMPPLEEFIPYLEAIWESKQLTNNGPFHQQLENALADYLDVKHLALFANGTMALIAALQVLKISGEVITTPYSFVATAHALLWNNIKPVFVDIDPKTCNLNPESIERAITSKTTAILPVHCYGNPCDVEKIEKIANKHALKVIYDAAHGFGVRTKGQTILGHGDLSVLSFHATKTFHTFEGGAIVCHDEKIKQHIDYLKNFGFSDELTVVTAGINGKMSELNAAFGLLQLKYVNGELHKRKNLDSYYRQQLAQIDGIQVLEIQQFCEPNFSYFPILINSEYPLTRDELNIRLRDHNIIGRRYFYPLISEFPMYNQFPSARRENLVMAHMVANQVLCLPMSSMLEKSDIDRIVNILKYSKVEK